MTMSPLFHKMPIATQMAKAACVTEFMVLGDLPNIMNRFMHTNSHEVLFVI